MNMRQFLLLPFLALIIFLAVSCNKKDYPETTTHSIFDGVHYSYDTTVNTYLLNNFIFEKGTYWIYKDSINGTRDTCMVDSLVNEVTFNLTPIGVHTSKYVYNIKSCNFYCSYGLFTNYLFIKDFTWNNSSYNIILDSVDEFDVFYPGPSIDFIPSYNIDTVSYTDVYKIYFTQLNEPYPLTSVPDSGYYYLKAGIGIIKADYYFDNQRTVYELVQYHINQ